MADVNQLFNKAAQLYRKGKIKDANKIYKKIVKQTPKFVDAVNMYGITLAQLGEHASAIKQFSSIIKLEPKKIAAYENITRVYIQLQRYSEAQTLFEQALKISPNDNSLLLGLAGALQSQGDLKGALASYIKAKGVNASDPALYINMGTVFSQLGKTEDAIDAFQQALSLDPKSADAHLRLGQLYIRNSNFIQAEKILFSASQLRENDFNIHMGLAEAYQQNAKNKEALEHFFIADKLEPKSQNVYTKLDKLILYSGSEEKAAILNNLNKENVYDNWDDAVNDARQLAQLLEYPDAAALTVLRQFLDKYNPAILHPREWWQQQLKLFGNDKFAHDKILRAIHSAVFSWSLPDKQTLTSIAKFVDGTRLYSYGAGSALWERLLSDHFAVDVVTTDFKPRHSYLPIVSEDYSASTITESDTIFLAWIIRGDIGVLNILNQLKSGQKLVLVGEPRDKNGIPRICATPEIFDFLDNDFTLVESIALVSYSMLNDTVSLYIKK